MASLDGLDPAGDRQMGIADVRRREQDDVLDALDESQTGELADLLAIDRKPDIEAELSDTARLDKNVDSEFRMTDQTFRNSQPVGALHRGSQRLAQSPKKIAHDE